MLHIAICDDEKIGRELLYHYLSTYLIQLRIKYHITECASAQELFEHLNHNFDIIFLDIKMDQLNGIEVAKIIRSRDNNVEIVFVSSYPEYAVSGYGVNAFRYLLKQDMKNHLNECMPELLSKLNYYRVEIKVNGEKILLETEDIFYFETKCRKIKVKMTNKEYCFYGKLCELERELETYGFIRVHQSFLVNIKKIISIDNDGIILQNHEAIPVSRNKKKFVSQKLLWSKR